MYLEYKQHYFHSWVKEMVKRKSMQQHNSSFLSQKYGNKSSWRVEMQVLLDCRSQITDNYSKNSETNDLKNFFFLCLFQFTTLNISYNFELHSPIQNIKT